MNQHKLEITCEIEAAIQQVLFQLDHLFLLQENNLFLELVSKELNHLAAILHVYAGVWILWGKKKKVIILQKKMEVPLHFYSFL